MSLFPKSAKKETQSLLERGVCGLLCICWQAKRQISVIWVHSCSVSSGDAVLFPSVGQPAAPSEGAAALCQASQAEPGPVPGPAWAAAPRHQHHLPGGLLRTPAGCQRERQEEDARQVSEWQRHNIIYGNTQLRITASIPTDQSVFLTNVAASDIKAAEFFFLLYDLISCINPFVSACILMNLNITPQRHLS